MKKLGNLVFVFLGILLVSFVIYNFEDKYLNVYKKINNFSDKPKDSYKDFYLGVLEITKINLKQKFFSIDSKYNTVDKNIELIKGSIMPSEKYSNLILAAHSGKSKIAYFKNLDKLILGDIAKVYYEEKTYLYEYVNFYQEAKDGTITIHRQKERSHLILITCDKMNDNLQNVYVFELKKIID